MTDTATREQRIVKIAAVSGLIGGVLAYLAFGFGLAGAVFVALLLALLVAVVLWMMWRDAATPASAAPQKTVTTAAAKPAATTPAATPQPAADPAFGAGSEVPDLAAAEDYTRPKSTDAQGSAAAKEVGAADHAAQSLLKPSARLAGQEDLAARKGSWKYDAKAAGASEVEATPDADHSPQAHPGAAGTSSVATADGAAEFDDAPQDKPQMMAQPRAGGADDLKQIKGVGPKLEEMLHEMGIYHFDQIAAWTDREVAWADENLKGFKGRVSRDTWVEQSKVLATGGATAFSDKVKKGDVY